MPNLTLTEILWLDFFHKHERIETMLYCGQVCKEIFLYQ